MALVLSRGRLLMGWRQSWTGRQRSRGGWGQGGIEARPPDGRQALPTGPSLPRPGVRLLALTRGPREQRLNGSLLSRSSNHQDKAVV